jgi:hypothetical protein
VDVAVDEAGDEPAAAEVAGSGSEGGRKLGALADPDHPAARDEEVADAEGLGAIHPRVAEELEHRGRGSGRGQF